jgi:uncharacterized membrane protein YbhN (UPF0104 family)
LSERKITADSRQKKLTHIRNLGKGTVLNLRKTLRIIVPSLLFLITVVYLLNFIPEIDFRTFSLLSYERWLAVLCLFFLVQLLNLYYFKLIIKRMCTIDSLTKLFQVLFASHSFNYAGPLKLGMPVRLVLFNQILGIPYAAGVATLMATTGLDIVVMITLAIALIAWIYFSPLVGLTMAAAIFACLIGSVTLYHKLPLARLKGPNWIGRFFSELANLSPVTIFHAVLISVAKTLLNAVAGWLVLTGLGALTGLAEFAFIYLASHLAGLLSLIPMGIGVKDVSAVELLSHLGVSPSIGIAFIAIDRLIWSLIPLIIGLLAGWQLGISELIKSASKKLAA